MSRVDAAATTDIVSSPRAVLGHGVVLAAQVTDLVQQRAQVRSERHHPLLLGGAHPELDLRPLAALGGVQPVQLAPARVRSGGEDLDAHRGRAEHLHETETHERRVRERLDPATEQGLVDAFIQDLERGDV